MSIAKKWDDLLYWANKSARNKAIAFFGGVVVFFFLVWAGIQILDLF